MQKRAEILKIDPYYPENEKITKAANFIKKGKLVALPTETVYGLGVAGLNPEVIKLLFEVKKRPKGKPIPLLISDFSDMERLGKDIPQEAWKVTDKFWPGPLTIVLFATELVPDIIKGKNLTVGIRIPDNKIALSLIKSSQTPIACSSANISGDKEPTTVQEVIASLQNKIDLIINGGKTKIGLPSTVLDLTGKKPTIIRQGAIKAKELLEVLKAKHILFVCTGNTCRSIIAEQLFFKMAKEENLLVEVNSAGTSAINKGDVSSLTLKTLEKEGIISSSKTFSKPLTERMIKKADLILVMEDYHLKKVLDISPSAKKKTFFLTEYAGLEKKEILDPMGSSWEGYETCLIEIKKCLRQVITRLTEK